MRRSIKIRLAVIGGAFVLGVAAALVALREPTEPLTSESLAKARQRWRDADVADYQIRFRMHGSFYDAQVEGGIVTEVKVNDRAAVTTDFRAYGVEGLFDTLAQELENISDPAGPFAGRSQGVIMRVRFHPKFGYVERYLRSAGGSAKSVSIELMNFTPGVRR